MIVTELSVVFDFDSCQLLQDTGNHTNRIENHKVGIQLELFIDLKVVFFDDRTGDGKLSFGSTFQQVSIGSQTFSKLLNLVSSCSVDKGIDVDGVADQNK